MEMDIINRNNAVKKRVSGKHPLEQENIMRIRYMMRRFGNACQKGGIAPVDPLNPRSTPAEAMELDIIYRNNAIENSVSGKHLLEQGNIMRV